MKKASQSGASREVLVREDWDFSSVPDNELEACFIWECARDWVEFDSIRDRNRLPDGGFVAVPDENHGMSSFLLLWEIATNLLPDRQLHAWQLYDQQARHTIAGRLQGGLWQIDGARMVSLEEMAREGHPLIKAADLVAYVVEWRESDHQILQQFAAWLRTNRKAPPVESRGSNPRDRLKMLGAMRLLHHLPFHEAFDLTVKTLGAPLYGKRPSWERARKGALEAFRLYLFDLDLSKAVLPKSAAKFSPRRDYMRF